VVGVVGTVESASVVVAVASAFVLVVVSVVEPAFVPVAAVVKAVQQRVYEVLVDFVSL